MIRAGHHAPWKLTLTLSALLVLSLLIADALHFGEVTLYPFLRRLADMALLVVSAVARMFGATRDWHRWNFVLALFIQVIGLGYALSYLVITLPEQWSDPELKVPVVVMVLSTWISVGIVAAFCVFFFQYIKHFAREDEGTR